MPEHEEQIDYRFVAKTVGGQAIEQMVAASNLDAAARQAWTAIQESDRNGVELASAKIEWDDARDGPQVEYLYDRKQGVEINRPSGITLSHEHVRAAREDAAYRAAGLQPDASAVPDVERRSRVDTEHELERFKKEQEIEHRADHQRVREWNSLVEGGSVSANGQEHTLQDLKSPAEMTKAEIITEARELHASFSEMMGRFETMQLGAERSLLREDMKPLALRENELREEYTGRLKTEMARNPPVSQNRAIENEISYSR